MRTRTDIRSEIARLRRQYAEAPQRAQQDALAQTLDALDTMGALEKLVQRLSRHLSHGPRAVSGLEPIPWVGAVIWQRAPGYFGYRTLTLFGAWAQYAGEDIHVCTGLRHLAYSIDFYDGEAYIKLIRRDFSLYYGDDGRPPPVEAWSSCFTYITQERLSQRDLLAKALSSLLP